MQPNRWRLAAFLPWVFATIALQWGLWGWEVEDAAISFAYARSWASGEGLVAQLGDEPVEGFSNPLWVALLALGQLAEIDPFVLSRWLGLIFGLGTVASVYAAVRPFERALPLAPLASAAVASVLAPQVIWAQSGLENALFSCLLAAGCARLAVAGKDDLLGPLLFLLLSLTRPEGIAYAAVAGCAVIAFSQAREELSVRAITWLMMLGVPMLSLEALRLWYFGQELPATFHAKLGQQQVHMLDASSRGWVQLVAFSKETGAVLLTPFVVIGASGASDWRLLAGLLGALLVASSYWLGPVAPIGLLLALLPLFTFGRRLPAGLAASLLLVAVAFHIATGGDWMRGFRWLSLASVPLSMLAGIGIAELVERFDPIWIGRVRIPALLPFGILGGLSLVPQALYVISYADAPETDPASVRVRLDHFLGAARRLQLDRRPRIVDHDMGGMLWFGGYLADIRDARGLVDLPFALYGIEREVVRHELFGDRPFDFAHAHAATGAALHRMPEFRERYVEIDPYGRQKLHGGQFAARALFLDRGSYAGTSLPVSFPGVEIAGIDLPSPEVGPGAGLYVEIGVNRGDGREIRPVLFLTDGESVATSWELSPAYGWVPRASWRPDEIFHGRFSLPIPEDLPLGSYDLGILLLDASGRVLPATAAAPGAVIAEPPALARGEVRLPGRVQIVSREEMNRFALEDLATSFERAQRLACEEAEEAWALALRHRTRSGEWRKANRPPVAKAIAACFAERAASRSRAGEDLLDRVDEIVHARDWDPGEGAVWRHAVGIAKEAHDRAVVATDPADIFRWAEAAVRADPRRTQDRRLAEKIRRRLLEINGPLQKSPEAEAAERGD